MPDSQTTPRSFESALAEFEALVEKMERGDLSLEDSVGAYERGVVLHRYCEQALSTAERKIRILTEGSGESGAEDMLQPFDPEAGNFRTSDEGAPTSASRDPDRRRRAGGDPRAAGDSEEDDIPF